MACVVCGIKERKPVRKGGQEYCLDHYLQACGYAEPREPAVAKPDDEFVNVARSRRRLPNGEPLPPRGLFTLRAAITKLDDSGETVPGRSHYFR